MKAARKSTPENKRRGKETLSKRKAAAGANGTVRSAKQARPTPTRAADLTVGSAAVNPQWPDVIVEHVEAEGPPAMPGKSKVPVSSGLDPAGEPPSRLTGQAKLVPLMTADKLLTTETEYLWRPYLPASGIALLTGESESGKSTAITAVAAQVTGGPMLEGKRDRPPGRVLVFGSEEDMGSTCKPRLEAAGADLSRVIFGDIGQDGKRVERLRLPDDTRHLRARVTDSGISLVTIDPLTGYLGDAVDERSNRQVREMLTQLADLAHELNVLILYTIHPRKSTQGGMKARVSGVAAWTEVPRVMVGFGRDPDRPEQRVLTMVKNSLGPDKPSRLFSIVDFEGAPRFVLGKVTSLTAEDIGGDGEAPADRDALAAAKAFLKDLLEGDEDVATTVVVQKATAANVLGSLKLAKHKLGVLPVKIGTGSAGFWAYRKPAAWPE
jgi:hypothetical protein